LAVVLVIVGTGRDDRRAGPLENLSGVRCAAVLQLAGLISVHGAVIITSWNAWLTWRDGRRWTRKTWNTLLAISSLVVLYVAFTFNLVSMTVKY
jgi:uncharacterized membrane protein